MDRGPNGDKREVCSTARDCGVIDGLRAGLFVRSPLRLASEGLTIGRPSGLEVGLLSVFRRHDMSQTLEVDRLRQLIALGPALVAELDLDTLLNRLLETAGSVTGAKYVAIGILDKERRQLERFVTYGLSGEQERAIGNRPIGRGVLGVLITDPRPLRLTDVTAHPSSSGFPAHHPPMRSFLGVPIIIRGRAWGNLYLTEKRIGEFTEADEFAATTLATWAAIAVDHARLLAGAGEHQGAESDEQPGTGAGEQQGGVYGGG